MRALINSTSSVYKYTADLQPQSLPNSVSRTLPGESDREELLLNKLGPKGWGRIHYFRSFYQPGWGDGKGRAISGKALESFYRFIEKADLPVDQKPSVFLTDRGGIEICWEDITNQTVQVEFAPHCIEIYRGSTQTESTLLLSEIQNAINLVL